MVVCSVLTAYFMPTVQTEKSVIMNEALKESATNPLNQPAGFAAPAATEEAPAEGTPAAEATDSAQ
jgi:preprotein translocase subunit SecG